MRKLLLAAGAWMALSTAAHAAITPVLDSVTPLGTDFEYSYSGTLAGDHGLVSGSELIIYDFAGYIAGSISAGIYGADLLAFTELTSALPPMFGYDDDPLIPNLVFKWVGAPFNASGGPFPDVDFAGLSAKSVFGETALNSYSSLTVTNNGKATGFPSYSAGSVAVPFGTIGGHSGGVPEIATWAMMITGLAGVGALLRRHRRPALAGI